MSGKGTDEKDEGRTATTGGNDRRSSTVRFDDNLHFIPSPEFPSSDAESTGADGELTPQMQHLKDYLAVCMGIQAPPKVLDEVTFEGMARYIASGKVHNIITMVGAGISTSAGIPDFRSPDVGLYDRLKKEYGVPDPAVLFTSQYFMKDPKPFYECAHLFFRDDYKPTPCHYFIRLLHEKGLLLRHYSQNIDTLDRMAGIPDDKLIEAHGSWSVSYCLECCEDYNYDWMKEKVRSGQVAPKCESPGCTGTIKPDIVLFGESLPWRLVECADEDFPKCDLLIIMGTSLTVQPFASLTHKVPIATPRLYINREKGDVGKKHPMSALLFGGSFDFDEEDNTRDVFKGTDCDAGCLELADLLGWGDELRELVKSKHTRLDELYASQHKSQAKGGATSNKGGTATSGAAPKTSPTKTTRRTQSATSAHASPGSSTVGKDAASKQDARRDSRTAATPAAVTNSKTSTGSKPQQKPSGAQGTKPKTPTASGSAKKTSASPRSSVSTKK